MDTKMTPIIPKSMNYHRYTKRGPVAAAVAMVIGDMTGRFTFEGNGPICTVANPGLIYRLRRPIPMTATKASDTEEVIWAPR